MSRQHPHPFDACTGHLFQTFETFLQYPRLDGDDDRIWHIAATTVDS